MSQSKMPATDDTEKKFVIKHVFKNVKKMKKDEKMDGPVEYHYNIPWKIRVICTGIPDFYISLECMESTDKEWSMRPHISRNIVGKNGKVQNLKYAHNYSNNDPRCSYYVDWFDINRTEYVVKMTVNIRDAKGLDFFKKFRNFDVEEDSDVTLIVKDQKFRVCKMYLAAQSSYFKSLFSGNFAESEKSEIELKDIDPNHFQRFLEFLYAESSIEDHSVLGILHLADFFDSKTVVRRCQEFLVQKSDLPFHQKFEAALKYNLEELKTKCISDMNSAADFQSIVPEKANEMDCEIWKELLNKALSLLPN